MAVGHMQDWQVDTDANTRCMLCRHHLYAQQHAGRSLALMPDVWSMQVPDIMALRNMENLSVSEGVAGVVKYGVKGLLGLAYKV